MDKKQADLIRAINRFLADVPDGPKGDGDGWAPVEANDVFRLHMAIQELMKAKWEPDAHGDLPVQVILIDRTQCWPLHYRPVPYTHRTEFMEGLWPTIANASLAMNELDREMRVFKERLRKLEPEQLELPEGGE